MNKFLSNSNLKLFAICFMLIDHFAVTILQNFSSYNTIYLTMRIIGRLAFPIFAFLIVEGFNHTKNINKYMIRLFVFAIISEIPFDLAFFNSLFNWSYQNVFFTLFFGLVTIYLFDRYRETNQSLSYLYLFLFGILSIILNTDYSIAGIIIIFAFYYFRGHLLKLTISLFLINLILIYDSLYALINQTNTNLQGIIQIFAVFSIILIYFYNHKKGYSLKFIFYFFYPFHMLILYLLNKFLIE